MLHLINKARKNVLGLSSVSLFMMYKGCIFITLVMASLFSAISLLEVSFGRAVESELELSQFLKNNYWMWYTDIALLLIQNRITKQEVSVTSFCSSTHIPVMPELIYIYFYLLHFYLLFWQVWFPNWIQYKHYSSPRHATVHALFSYFSK